MRRKTLKRISRADLLWGALFFALANLGFAFVIEIWLPQVRDPAYACRAHHLKRRVAEAPSPPFTFVALGSSRVAWGLDAKDLECQLERELRRPVIAFNYGFFGGGPLVNLLALKRLAADGVRPDIALIEVFPILLVSGNVSLKSHTLAVEQLTMDELNWLGRYGFSVADLRQQWLSTWAVPGYRHRERILGLLSGFWKQSTGPWGWSGSPDPPQSPEHRRLVVEQDRPREYGELQNLQLGGIPCQALRDLLDACREQGTTAMMIWMPEADWYRNYYPVHVLAQCRNLFADLSREYGAPLIDARDWVPAEGFGDSVHVHCGGAKTFTDRLSAELLKRGVGVEGSPLVTATHRELR